MKQIFVLVEHRQGQVRDITFEMLTKGTELAKTAVAELTAVLLGGTEEQAKNLAQRANRVLFIQDEKLSNFNSEFYQKALVSLIGEHKPLLTMIGHTSYGVELAPILAVSSNIPLATDCIDLNFENKELIITRQIYGGKVNVEAELREAESYLVTVRQASFPAEIQTQIKYLI